MNKIRKLLIFSCCIMIAAFAALWVSCKNSIPLVAEEPEVVVTQPKITVSKSKGMASNLNLEASGEGLPQDVKYYWIIYNSDSESGAGWYELVTNNYGSKLEVVYRNNTTAFCIAEYKQDNQNCYIASNIVDCNDEESVVVKACEYNEKGQQFARVKDLKGYYFADNKRIFKEYKYKQVTNAGEVELSNESGLPTDVGVYKVYTTLRFLDTTYKDVDQEVALPFTKKDIETSLGYFAICPKKILQTKDIIYGEELGEITLADGWEFISEKPQSDVKLSVGKYEYEVRYGEKIEITNNESLSNFIKGLNYTEKGKDYYYYDAENNYWKSRFQVNVKARDLSTDTSLTAELKEPSVTYTGEAWSPEVIVSLDEAKLSEGTDYDIEFPEDMITEGEKQIIVKFKGNYSGEKTLTGEILPSSWGKLVIDGDYKYWVDDEGTTSARITKGKNIWLKESSDGESTWYGLDNTNSVFTEGSRFWVRWLGREDDKEEWNKYYEQLDDEYKKKVEDNKLWIFLCGVTDPDGNEYTTLATSTNLYVQLGSDWDKDDIQAVFISQAIDEPVESIEYISDFKNSPTGTGDYAKLKLKHFSPYAVYDELTDEEREMLDKILNGDISEDELNDMISEAEQNEPTVPDDNDSLNNFESSEPSISYITGDQRGYVIAIAVCALIVAGVTLLFSLKSKKNKK